MNRYEFSKQFSDEEKLAYFEKKRKEAKDFATKHRYAVYAFNLRGKIERNKNSGKRK